MKKITTEEWQEIADACPMEHDAMYWYGIEKEVFVLRNEDTSYHVMEDYTDEDGWGGTYLLTDSEFALLKLKGELKRG